MTLDIAAVKAVVFDYGNTLVPFGRSQWRAYGHSLAGALERIYGPVDLDRFFALRALSRDTPFAGDPPTYRENDLAAITRRLVRELYGREAVADELTALLRAREEAFVENVVLPDGVTGVLERLRARFPLGLLSNYPDGGAIRRSLRAVGIADHFSGVVVSADLGYVKPHPILFAAVLEQFGVASREVLYVGDNWLADVQGAKRVGMQVAQAVYWGAAEHFPRQDGDAEPDAVLERLEDLVELLEC